MSHVMRSSFRLLLFSSFILHPSSSAQADGGAVRLSEQVGDYRLTVFTTPTPFRAGPVDISVLVQDGVTGEPVTPARVILCLTARASGQVLEHAATSEAATNKLLQAAVFELPEAGWWDVEVDIDGPHGPAQSQFAVEADRAPPRWLDLWPWFAWPAFAVALFALHQRLARKRPLKA
jgi:hypothetical protein